jgi:Fur family transcriptional regulator, zinc uptake regulator
MACQSPALHVRGALVMLKVCALRTLRYNALMTETPGSPFPGPEHDHRRCVDEAMGRARETFAKKGMKLTPLRERMLAEILTSHKPVGAYELVHRLTTAGSRVTPISVYRVIDALLAAGLVRRLKSQNAFFASHGWHQARPRQFPLLCKVCGLVAEADGERIFSAIVSAARVSGFLPEDAVIEVFGLCGNCATQAKRLSTTSRQA